MKTNKELRQAAWDKLRDGHWFWRLVGACALSLGIYLFAVIVISYLEHHCGIVTMQDIRLEQLTAQLEGHEFVPDSSQMVTATIAQIFENFVFGIFAAIMALGMAGVFLRVARGKVNDYLAPIWEGFKCPFRTFWLQFRVSVVIAFYMLPAMVAILLVIAFATVLSKTVGFVLIIPAWLAVMIYSTAIALRYTFVWQLRTDNPEMSAKECMDRSCQLMKGNRWRYVCFLCSYWLFSLLIFVPFVNLWAFPQLIFYMSVGSADFYRDLIGESDEQKLEPETISNNQEESNDELR